MLGLLRKLLRKIPYWVYLQELRREGFYNAYKRLSIQKKILRTHPVITNKTDDVEIHVLTWRKDYLNLIWSLKTFYKLSEKKYPLVIHDGGLKKRHRKRLLKHFPLARMIIKNDADRDVGDYLESKGFSRSKEYRTSNVASLKIFDYFYYSNAKRIIHIDSDVVFFKKPEEFLEFLSGSLSVFNKDMNYAYSISPTDLFNLVGESVPTLINSGLFVIDKDSINLSLVDSCLKENSMLFDNKWVTEQTLHAICATKYGHQFLSSDYLISTLVGLPENLVCKHYTGFFRPLFYQEGLQKVVDEDLLDFL